MEALAQVAGVSKITVSRALRDSDLVTPETRQRIKQLAEAHGYRMNHSARNLRLQRSHTVAVILEMQPNADRPMSEAFPLHLLAGIMQALTLRNYGVLLMSLASFDHGMAFSTDGLILLGQGSHHSAASRVAAVGRPFVMWGAAHDLPPMRPGVQAVVVGSDNVQAGATVAQRFLALRRRHIVFLGDTSHPEVADRYQGLQSGLAGSRLKARLLAPAAFTFSAGMAALQSCLADCAQRGLPPPDAVFAASDLLAMGALRAVQDAGMRVPQAVSVVGCDDSPTAKTFAPALSSVHQDWHRGGELLAQKVLGLIDGLPLDSVVMPTSLVVRET